LKRLETSLPGVHVIQPDVFADARGFFLETYHAGHYEKLGIADRFVQDNHSRSCRSVLRGLHYQLPHSQSKLCYVIEGEALDVAVDIRLGSPTFGQWTSVVLTAKTHNQIYIPAGFAHGFLVLSESAQFLYKCSDFFERDAEHGVAWNDPELNIAWGIAEPILSEKDRQAPRLRDISQTFLPKYLPR
jgi:dTDP-4-dehydrorhamnose 3,5-epimerase